MKKILLAFLSVALFFASNIASAAYVQNIFIDSDGNNSLEAKMKANIAGMRQTLIILASRMNIKILEFPDISYDKLAEAFKISRIMDEKSENARYSANVDYQYDQYKVNDLILKYGGQASDQKSYEYLIIPIFKQQKFISLWDYDITWLNAWHERSDLLEQKKLLYPDTNLQMRDAISIENVLTLSHDEFLALFPDKLFKQVLLVVAEYFTKSDSGETFLKINYIKISHDSTAKSSNTYDLLDKNNPTLLITKAVDDAIDIFGKDRPKAAAEETRSDIVAAPQNNDNKEIIMHAEIYSSDDLKRFTNKLENVPQIQKFTNALEYGKKYQVNIYTNSSFEELTIWLYSHGLSYNKVGDSYNLIEIESGV